MFTWNKKQVTVTADAVEGSWVYRNAPLVLRPYLKLARMDRPVGTWLLLWPCWWSVALATEEGSFPSLLLLLLFAVGSLAMRGAGCTYNDIIDRDFDGQVERTRSRPIPAGEVSVKAAWGFLVFQCLIGLLVLLNLGMFAIGVGLASLLLVAAYPFMKRITYWPQAWLGLTFNWGALVGYAAVTGELTLAPIVLYVGGIFWTLGYDTIYAHQDTDDDLMIGVKSSALALGDKTQAGLMVFYGLFLVALLFVGALANLGEIYYTGCAFAALHMGMQIRRVDISSPGICLEIFRSNIHFGWIVFLSIVVDKLVPSFL
ncbi:4-hydroxybenzoate octaprenyltransferase [Kordiimonas sediminis]|uniref:4-hydroxybenzoate octaprenyltransferase n=1 Tax=Kordiimonas sediminis TaxID=1735581 RepID=A0A919AYS5_9PROT|nr:4-hydroxybenzoate octaprenyltransferase [Kordiimonas sediminis]GHF30214.1 4-hydroxybenzoate octaprenyltransferase [Kordiimonas sediminis]